jgi:fibronectin-binding autotransporter adhesin
VGGALASFGGSGTFTKTGSGTLAISGNSTYTGSFNQNAGVTDVSDTLDASAGISVAGGRLNVGTGAAVGDVSQNGGTVSGGGLIDGNFVQNSGVLSPGNSPGTLFIAGNATWNGGSYLWEVTTVNPGTPGTDWDYVDITGTLTIGGGYTVNVDDLNALPGWNTANNYSWLIATADGGISGFGSLGLNVGGFDQNPYGGSFSLRQDGNDIYLDYTGGPLGPGPGPSAVPEPNALSLTMLAGLLLVSFRQKMRQMRRQVTASA